MKKFYLMVFVAFSIAISSCDNQAKQREIEKQRQEDSIRVAENVKKELAEKEAKERAEREEQEEKKRAEREKQEAQERAEREAKTWTGASSISELRSKLMGTIWETTYDVLRYKVTFYNDEVNMCITDLSGNRFKDEKTYKYEVMSKGERFVVGFGNVENYETYQIGFLGSRAILFANSNRLGELTFMGR